jgi:hypothetical protein
LVLNLVIGYFIVGSVGFLACFIGICSKGEVNAV